jgi:hypothetical protein
VKRRLIMFACAGIVGLGAMAGFAVTPAHAAGLTDVTCAGTESGVISPGLLLTPRTVTVTSTKIFSPCVSTDPSLTAGLSSSTVTGIRSCLNLDSAHSGVAELVWNNGQASTFAYNATASNPAGQAVVTFTGTITFGEFTGDTAVMVITSATLNVLACLAPPGVTSTSGIVTLDITGL